MSVTQVIRSVDIPGYRILRSLGEGGMASVYLAVQESLDREVALKVMSSTLAANAEFTDRFLKEGRLTAKLSHPNIVTVYDIGQLTAKHGTPRPLEGITVNGRLGVIYSQDGLNNTANTQGCCCCGGNEITNCEQVNVNILAYALLY